jgi:hypothetical protein
MLHKFLSKKTTNKMKNLRNPWKKYNLVSFLSMLLTLSNLAENRKKLQVIYRPISIKSLSTVTLKF